MAAVDLFSAMVLRNPQSFAQKKSLQLYFDLCTPSSWLSQPRHHDWNRKWLLRFEGSPCSKQALEQYWSQKHQDQEGYSKVVTSRPPNPLPQTGNLLTVQTHRRAGTRTAFHAARQSSCRATTDEACYWTMMPVKTLSETLGLNSFCLWF